MRKNNNTETQNEYRLQQLQIIWTKNDPLFNY